MGWVRKQSRKACLCQHHSSRYGQMGEAQEMHCVHIHLTTSTSQFMIKCLWFQVLSFNDQTVIPSGPSGCMWRERVNLSSQMSVCMSAGNSAGHQQHLCESGTQWIHVDTVCTPKVLHQPCNLTQTRRGRPRLLQINHK